MTQLIIIQAVQNVQETVVPIIKQKYALYMNARSSKSSHPYKTLINEDSSYDYLNIEEFAEDDPIVEQNKYECTLDAYDSTYEDYLELYVQFGYVVLFSSVAPWAALCAFINNVLEIRLDAFKVGHSQRYANHNCLFLFLRCVRCLKNLLQNVLGIPVLGY